MSCRFHCWCWSWGLERFENTPLVSRKSKSTTPLCCPVGYTLWSVDFTVRHMNLIRSAICRFYCLMCILWLPQFLSFSSISSLHLSYLTYNTKDLFPSSAYNVYVFYNLCFSIHFNKIFECWMNFTLIADICSICLVVKLYCKIISSDFSQSLLKWKIYTIDSPFLLYHVI